jgi:hypothetical protein
MAAPSISAQEQRRIELLIASWKGKLTWHLLVQAIELELGIKTTRQTLCTYAGIYAKYSKRKAALRGVSPDIARRVTLSDINAHDRIERLETEVKELNQTVAEQLRVIERMLANAAAIPNVDLGGLLKPRPEEIRNREKE